jgi:hypothetical protein
MKKINETFNSAHGKKTENSRVPMMTRHLFVAKVLAVSNPIPKCNGKKCVKPIRKLGGMVSSASRTAPYGAARRKFQPQRKPRGQKKTAEFCRDDFRNANFTADSHGSYSVPAFPPVMIATLPDTSAPAATAAAIAWSAVVPDPN